MINCFQKFILFLAATILSPLAFSAEFAAEEISPAHAAEWTHNGYRDPQAYNIEVSRTAGVKYTHSIDLSVVVFKNAGWNNLQLVADHFQRVSDIYNKCQIKIGDISMVMVDAGTNVLSEGETEYLAKRTPAYFGRPTLYFATKVSDKHDAYAWSGDVGCDGFPARCNTAWISSIVNANRYKSIRDPDYSVVAHELAHILGDYDHVEGKKNILGTFEFGDDSITAEQCKKFKTFSEMTEL